MIRKKMNIQQFFFLIFVIVSFIVMVHAHEYVHYTIFENYDIKSRIDWFSEFPVVVTIAELEHIDRCNDTCLLAHQLNEIVFYPLSFLYIMIALGIYILIGTKDGDNENFKNYSS